MALSITQKTSTQHKGHNSENIGVIVGCWKKHSLLQPQQDQWDGLIRMVWMTSLSSSRQREVRIYFPKHRISKAFSGFFFILKWYLNLYYWTQNNMNTHPHCVLIFAKKTFNQFLLTCQIQLRRSSSGHENFPRLRNSPVIKDILGVKDTFIIVPKNNHRNFFMKGQNLQIQENFSFNICFNRCG